MYALLPCLMLRRRRSGRLMVSPVPAWPCVDDAAIYLLLSLPARSLARSLACVLLLLVVCADACSRAATDDEWAYVVHQPNERGRLVQHHIKHEPGKGPGNQNNDSKTSAPPPAGLRQVSPAAAAFVSGEGGGKGGKGRETGQRFRVRAAIIIRLGERHTQTYVHNALSGGLFICVWHRYIIDDSACGRHLRRCRRTAEEYNNTTILGRQNARAAITGWAKGARVGILLYHAVAYVLRPRVGSWSRCVSVFVCFLFLHVRVVRVRRDACHRLDNLFVVELVSSVCECACVCVCVCVHPVYLFISLALSSTLEKSQSRVTDHAQLLLVRVHALLFYRALGDTQASLPFPVLVDVSSKSALMK